MKQMKQKCGAEDPKSSNGFSCEKCDYKCCKLSLFNRHLLTDKHKKRENETDETKNETKVTPQNFVCKCGKNLNSRTTLWRHKKQCDYKEKKIIEEPVKEEPVSESNNADLQCLLLETLKQNQELQKQIIEISKDRNTIIQNTTNNNNNSFNLNIFLNEKCKDALNIQDFVNTIKLQLSDLEETGRLGYVEGLTNILVRGLKELDVHKRPIHCSDLKREVLYVKDKDEWSKEDNEKDRIKKAIKQISIRNAKQINEWTRQNQGYNDSANKKSDKYLKLVIEANGGEPEEINKIIKQVAKQVTIDKIEK
jgi:hypothetical protein